MSLQQEKVEIIILVYACEYFKFRNTPLHCLYMLSEDTGTVHLLPYRKFFFNRTSIVLSLLWVNKKGQVLIKSYCYCVHNAM